MNLDATVDTKAVTAYLGALADQLPRRVGFALNTTANAMQKGVRESLANSFTLRRAGFVRATIYRAPKEDFPDVKMGRLVAGVRINPDRDVLAKFEEGGEKRPDGKRLAVPILRQTQPRLVIGRDSKYHLRLLPPDLFGKAGRVSTLLHRARKVIADTRANRKKDARFFGLVSRSGTPLIFEVLGKNRKRLIYAFVRRVPLPRKLRFYETAERVFTEQWPTILQKELDEALRRAAAKQSP